MIHPVAHVIIQYLEPSYLRNFFVKNSLNCNMKFIYTVYNGIKCDELCIILKYFPNMMLTGIIFDFSKHKYNYNENFMKQYSNRFKKLSYCTLYDCCGKLYLNSLKWMNKYTKINRLNLINCTKLNNIFEIYDDIKYLMIGRTHGISPTMISLSKCTNLERLIINDNIFINDSELAILSNLKKLTHLKLSASLNGYFALNCINLRVLKIKKMCITTLNILIGCHGLEHLIIVNCPNLTDISDLKKCHKLKSLTIKRCEKFNDVYVSGKNIRKKLNFI